MTQADWKEIDAKLIARASEDPAFRALLLANPTAAAARAGVGLPAGTELKVVEAGSKVSMADTPGVHMLVLPGELMAKGPEEFELSDEELEGVSGAGPTEGCADLTASSFTPTCPGYKGGVCN